jgi:hypothetical protein
MNIPKQSEPSELASLDQADAIAREALEEARCLDGTERYRNNPGPLVPPIVSVGAP